MDGTNAFKWQQQNQITSPNPLQIFANSCFDNIKQFSSTFGHGNLHSLLTTVFSSLKAHMESSFSQIKAGNPVAGGFPCAQISSTLKKGSDLGSGRSTLGISMSTEDIEERLEGVPVFALCNPSDDFVLISDSRKRGSFGFFCLGQEEANLMLECMKSMDPPMPHGSKIVPVALNKVFQLKVDGVTFRLIPEVSQIRNAIKERKKLGGLEDDQIRGVPAFQSESLVLRSEGKRYNPIFLRKEDLEKSIRRASNPRRLPGRYFTHGDVKVVVLEDIIEAMKDGKSSKWNDAVFIPPGVEISLDPSSPGVL